MTEQSTSGCDSASSCCENQQNDIGLSENAAALRSRLAAIPVTNALEFLAKIREIACEIDLEAKTVSEELASVEESYPKILATLEGFKQDLLLLKEEVCLLRTRYNNCVSSFMDLIQKHCPSLIPHLQSLSRKQVLLKRMKWANRGRDLMSNCRQSMKESKCDWPRLSQQFQNACEHALEIDQFGDNSSMTFNDEMTSLSTDLSEFSRRQLKAILDDMNYPFEDSVDLRIFENKMVDIINILSLIYLVAEHIQNNSGHDEICRALLDPFEIRFAFHFHGDRKTNDIWKPQWYLSQTLNWIQVNLPFFVTVLDKVLKKHNLSLSSSHVFLNFLTNLPIVKTRALLKQEEMLDNVSWFSNLIDECIAYETHLRDLYPYQYSSTILSLFCGEDILSRWIEIENDCCLDRVDAMLSAPDRWKNRFREMEEADQFLVCNCTDAFVSMIQSQQNRARLLPEILAQRRFVDLQLLLTDDFRKRLVHIAKQSESPWSEPFPHVMNAVWYLKHVVEEWSDNCLLGGITSSGKRAVFDESSAMFRHVWNQMAEDIIKSLKLQVIDMIRPYQQHHWCSMEPQFGSSSRELTALFCPVLVKIRSSFATTGTQISKASLEELFKRMSSTLAIVVTDEIVNVTPFSAEGASQMLFDIENGLLPVLSHIFVRCGVSPNMYYDEAFTTLLGSLKLLSLSWAVITLLKDEIDQVPDEIAEEKLFEMKIYGVNKERARNLIRLRSDIETK